MMMVLTHFGAASLGACFGFLIAALMAASGRE